MHAYSGGLNQTSAPWGSTAAEGAAGFPSLGGWPAAGGGGAAAAAAGQTPPGSDPKVSMDVAMPSLSDTHYRQDPLFVVMGNPTWKTQLWRTARMLLLGFLVVSGVGALMEVDLQQRLAPGISHLRCD